MPYAKQMVKEMLAGAGIILNGSRPWDPQIKDPRVFGRVLKHGSLGLGEAYMDGWWTCANLAELVARVCRTNFVALINQNPLVKAGLWPAVLLNWARQRSFQVGQVHYDIGNDLYQAMLGRTMAYACALFGPQANTLDQAQEAKLDLVCRKLKLKPGLRVLDIGCGFGSFAKFAGERYGVNVTGLTISREQALFCLKFCKGLEHQVLLQDYRTYRVSPNRKFDRIVSIGMFEHVGWRNYRAFFTKAAEFLKDDGLFLLHAIGTGVSKKIGDPWIQRHIFPNSHIPAMAQISQAFERLFVLEHWENIGPHYYHTLLEWDKNCDLAYPKLKYPVRFQRMWKFYLQSCAGLFKARDKHVWQMVLTKNGLKGGYEFE